MSTVKQHEIQAANILTAVQARTSSMLHVVQTNKPPSDLEVKEISPLLRDLDTEVSRFRGQYMDPYFEVTVYSPLKSLHAALKGAVSLLRHIPAEIISQIFYECLEYDAEDDEETFWNTLDVTQAPWTLTKVSQRWREIALANQKLWSCIRIDSWAMAIAAKPQPTLSKLIACLERTGEHPLSIHFTDRYPSSFGSKPLFLHLLSYSERWTYLKLSVSFSYLELATPLKGRLPQLQTLIIEADGLNTFGSFDAFEVAPKLQKAGLIITDPYELDPRAASTPSDIPYVVKVPWGQLTFLAIDSLEALKHAPQLVNCGLRLSVVGLPRKISIIQHVNIRSLLTNLVTVLHHLEIPSLESLHVSTFISDLGALRLISSFIVRSSCSLKTLTLRIAIDSGSDLRLLLQNAPNLVSFEVEPGHIGYNIVARSLAITEQSRLVPKLERIAFYFSSGRTEVDFDILVGMLESRCGLWNKGDTKHLRSITLHGHPPPIPPQFMPRLLELKKLGLGFIYHKVQD